MKDRKRSKANGIFETSNLLEWWWEKAGVWEPVREVVDVPWGATRAVLEHYGAHVPDEQPGRVWVHFLCPFHDDRRNSASLSTAGFFMCHACGVRGKAVRLVMEQEGLSRVEALEWISKLT